MPSVDTATVLTHLVAAGMNRYEAEWMSEAWNLAARLSRRSISDNLKNESFVLDDGTVPKE